MNQLTFKPNANKQENEEMRKAFTKRLSEKLREIRKNKGFKQEELSEFAGLDESYVGHLERGVYSPTAFVMWKISQALNVPVSELLDF